MESMPNYSPEQDLFSGFDGNHVHHRSELGGEFVDDTTEASWSQTSEWCNDFSDLELDASSDTLSLATSVDPDDRSRTPPKRVRREGSYEYSKSPSVATVPPPSSSPSRQRKRSSEELEDGGDIQQASGKRLRPEVVERTSLRVLSPEAPTRQEVAVDGGVSAN